MHPLTYKPSALTKPKKKISQFGCRLVFSVIDSSIRLVATLIVLSSEKLRSFFASSFLLFLKLKFVFRVYIPLVSKFEWHPFSISSSPFDPQLTLHVRVGGGRWGKNLYKVASGQDDHHSSSRFIFL